MFLSYFKKVDLSRGIASQALIYLSQRDCIPGGTRRTLGFLNSNSHFRNSLDVDFLMVRGYSISLYGFFAGAPPCGCPDTPKYSAFWVGTGTYPYVIDRYSKM